MDAVTIATIEAQQLKAKLDSGHPFEFWNVLTDDYFHNEMIPGSRRVPVDGIGRQIADSGLARNAEIIVYCAGPECPQSRLAGEKLAKLGFTNVVAFEGGIVEWKKAGLPIETLSKENPDAGSHSSEAKSSSKLWESATRRNDGARPTAQRCA